MTETHKEMEEVIQRLETFLGNIAPAPWTISDHGEEIEVTCAPHRVPVATVSTGYTEPVETEQMASAGFIAFVRNELPALLSAYAGMKEALEKIEKFEQKEMPEASRGIPIKERLWPRAQISNMCHIAREALSALPTGEAGGIAISKDWCAAAAEAEDGCEVGAGVIGIDPSTPEPEPTREAVSVAQPLPPVEEGVPSGNGWRTMESAPRDGTVIDILLNAQGRIPDAAWGMTEGLAGGDIETWINSFTGMPVWGPHEGSGAVTHWMPRPALPGEAPATSPSKERVEKLDAALAKAVEMATEGLGASKTNGAVAWRDALYDIRALLETEGK